jgi:hypothetical protein
MIKTHEINLNVSTFNKLTNNNYMIVEKNNIEINDYILFKQVEIINEEIRETGVYRMTKVIDIYEDAGLKDNYILLVLNKM